MIVDEAIGGRRSGVHQQVKTASSELASGGTTASGRVAHMFFIEHCATRIYIKPAACDDGPPARICKRYEENYSTGKFASHQRHQRVAKATTRRRTDSRVLSSRCAAPTPEEIQRLLDDPSRSARRSSP